MIKVFSNFRKYRLAKVQIRKNMNKSNSELQLNNNSNKKAPQLSLRGF
jgi:hypothetical protein